MRKLETIEVVNYTGGKLNWGSFATGFCDGLFIGSLLIGNIGGAAGVYTACDLFGAGSNLYDHLP